MNRSPEGVLTAHQLNNRLCDVIEGGDAAGLVFDDAGWNH
jgi:hypothetical protein